MNRFAPAERTLRCASDARSSRRAALAAPLILLCLSAPGSSERLPLQRFDQANGLADDSVCAVRQDSRGFVWFGTGAGISRFDGVEFRNYAAAEGIPEGPVCDFLETREGELLFATAGGVCRLLPRAGPGGGDRAPSRRLFDCAPEVAGSRVLHQDRRGGVWAGGPSGLFRGTRGATAWRFDRVPLASPSDPWAEVGVREIVEGAAGDLWIATALGVARLDPTGHIERFSVSGFGLDERVFSLLLDSVGRLWIGHVNDGVFVWMPPPGFSPPPGWSVAGAAVPAAVGRNLQLPRRAGEVVRIGRAEGLDDERARAGLLEDRDGAIWLGTVHGLARIHAGRLELFGRGHGLPDEGTRPSLVDRAGNIWFGSPSGGAARLRRRGFTTYDHSDGLLGYEVRSIFDGRDGALYVYSSADRDYLQRFDGARFTAMAPRLPDGGGWWVGQVVLEDREGDWWLPTGLAGLLRFPARRDLGADALQQPRAHYRASERLSDAAQVLYEDRRGDIWIGAFVAPRLSVWRRATGRFESFGAQLGFPTSSPITFAEDAAGTLWIGFGDGALGAVRDGSFHPLDRSRLPPWSAVYDLHFDSEGRLWAATIGAGVVRFDAPGSRLSRVRSYTTVDGLSSNDVTCLAEDSFGRIFAGTLRGVTRLDPGTGETRRFTTGDGLANHQVRAAHRDRNGDLWFGTLQGLSRLHQTPDRRLPPPTVLLMAVEVDGRPLALDERGATRLDTVELPAAERLTVRFVAPSADLAGEPTYRYRLEGLENEWSVATADRAVTYAGIAPGSFHFSVIAEMPAGEASAPAGFDLTIPPPLWRRWWALAGLAALPLAGAWVVHRQRVGRLVAVERVRTRIAADLHDDLGASLSRIAVLSEVASRKSGGEGGGAVTELGEIADTARRITEEAGDIVWSIDPRQDDLESLLLRVRALAGDLLGERGIALSWSTAIGSGTIRLAPDVRRHLLLILKEAIHNAVRHSSAGRVDIRIEAPRRRIVACVHDDGVGFDVERPASAASGGRGLDNLRARAREVGGRLEIRSVPGGGTAVSIEIPR